MKLNLPNTDLTFDDIEKMVNKPRMPAKKKKSKSYTSNKDSGFNSA